MDFMTYLFQNAEFQALLVKTLTYIAAIIIHIAIIIAIAKYLIRYAVKQYFKMKDYTESRDKLDEIQIELMKSKDFTKGEASGRETK